eukprot:Hpha_TRINITY_DN19776_c0_g1::TRINITY_DN19776_c0_g1_i1::g.21858::m.21858
MQQTCFGAACMCADHPVAAAAGVAMGSPRACGGACPVFQGVWNIGCPPMGMGGPAIGGPAIGTPIGGAPIGGPPIGGPAIGGPAIGIGGGGGGALAAGGTYWLGSGVATFIGTAP